MPRLIESPARIEAPGGKTIDEHIGRVNTGSANISVAHMRSPAGWSEPGQKPEFDEYTIVLAGFMRVEHPGGVIDARAGQAVFCGKQEWIRYSTPEGAEYIAICLPAFHPDTVNRDPS